MIQEHIREEIFNTFNIDLELEKDSLQDIIKKLKAKKNLEKRETIIAMSSLMSPDVSTHDIAVYLTALHEKGETVEEIATSARVMRIFASKIYNEQNKEEFLKRDIVDCCGTGGGVNIFNISTAVSFILAAGGLYVAKHGNRAITSLSGSADVLEALGAKIDIPATKVGKCILHTRIGFLFAPLFHQATKNVQLVRRKLPHKTIFNLLGPLTNPAEPKFQIIGVYDQDLTEKIINVLKLLGVKKAFVVHGFTPCGKGIDEVSTLGLTKVSELLTNGEIKNYLFDIKDVGLAQTTPEALQGGDAIENARLIKGLFNGSITGAQEEIVSLNAAFGFVASNRVQNVQEGFELSRRLMSDGSCTSVLNSFIKYTKEM